MKASEIMEILFSLADKRDYSKSGDICIAGSPERNVEKVAVAMFATPNLIKDAHAWGADLLIVHEPVYNNATNGFSDTHQDQIKRALIDSTGMTVWRYHDHPHYTTPDIIAAGQLQKLNLQGTIEYTDTFDLVRFRLDCAISPTELAKKIKSQYHLSHIRICGVTDTPCTNLSCMFGAPGGVFRELDRPETEIVIVGETAEWCNAQYAKDAAEFGQKKALLILGHIGSERDGMAYTAGLLKDKAPGLDVMYFECGEVYSSII